VSMGLLLRGVADSRSLSGLASDPAQVQISHPTSHRLRHGSIAHGTMKPAAGDAARGPIARIGSSSQTA
jgi:hypothetical protein